MEATPDSSNRNELPARRQFMSNGNCTTLSFPWFAVKSVATKVRGELAETTQFLTAVQYFSEAFFQVTLNTQLRGHTGREPGAKRVSCPSPPQRPVSACPRARTTEAAAGTPHGQAALHTQERAGST